MVTDLSFNKNLVMVIQNHLNNIKNLYPSLPSVTPTGIYDEATQNAVLIFQKIKGLSPTGFVDVPTLNALVHENHECIKKTQMPYKISFSTRDFVDVKLGDQRDIVYVIKVMINGFCRRYVNYNKLEVTNLFDEETEEAVRLFQQRSMLPPSGIVDIKTWNALVKIYDVCRLYKENSCVRNR